MFSRCTTDSRLRGREDRRFLACACARWAVCVFAAASTAASAATSAAILHVICDRSIASEVQLFCCGYDVIAVRMASLFV